MVTQYEWTRLPGRERWRAWLSEDIQLYVEQNHNGNWECWVETVSFPGRARALVEGDLDEAQQMAEQLYREKRDTLHG